MKINSDESLSNLFWEMINFLDVVLACSLLQNEKAELVKMVKRKHKTKTILAIGDGANDVAMI